MGPHAAAVTTTITLGVTAATSSPADLLQAFVDSLSSRELKETLVANKVDVSDCVEKTDYKKAMAQLIGTLGGVRRQAS